MMKATQQQIREKYDMALERIETYHLRNIGNSRGNVFLISNCYPGVWLEHAYDALCYASLYPGDKAKAEIAENQMLLFVRNRLPNGHLPYMVLDADLIKDKPQWGRPIGYRQIQECVAFAGLCLDTYKLSGNKEFLRECFEACEGWVNWLTANRMSTRSGLVETYCLFDTGHDNSCRLLDIPNGCRGEEGTMPADCPYVPMLSPDVNAVYYGNLSAVSEMAGLLGQTEKQNLFAVKARQVKQKMFELLYDPNTAFFYDREANGTWRKIKSISITNVFSEHMLTQAEFDAIYDRHMTNPEEFATEYPFPSVAVCDSAKYPHAASNCWGYFSQALTALRAQRWMDFYHRSEDLDKLLEKWVHVMAVQTEKLFTQEMDPFTGETTDCSQWYSSAMLTYLYAVKRLKLL